MHLPLVYLLTLAASTTAAVLSMNTLLPENAPKCAVGVMVKA